MTLINPTDSTIEGELVLLLDDGTVDSGTSYTIASRSAYTVRLSDEGPSIRIGQGRVLPKTGNAAPDGVLVFSYAHDGVTVGETGVPAVGVGAAFRTYVEGTSEVQTGLAVANASASPAALTLSLTNLMGEDLGMHTTLSVSPNGHRALFLREIPAFAGLPSSFRGVLRIRADGNGAISMIALRGRYNERNDFLVSTFPVVEEGVPAPGRLIFPHLADGGGYTTEFILFGTSQDSASGTLLLRKQSGNPLLVEFR